MAQGLNPPIIIKRASSKDLIDINQLILASKQSWGYPESWMALWRAGLRVTAETLLQREFWMARDSVGQAVFVYSLCKASADGHEYELEDFWAEPTVKSTGLGRRMFSHLHKQLKAHGASKLTIVSDPHAEGFYLKMGARRVGEQASEPAGRILPVLSYELQSARMDHG